MLDTVAERLHFRANTFLLNAMVGVSATGVFSVALAAGALSPLATLVLVLLTIFGADVLHEVAPLVEPAVAATFADYVAEEIEARHSPEARTFWQRRTADAPARTAGALPLRWSAAASAPRAASPG